MNEGKEKEEKEGRRDRPVRHVNEFFEGRAKRRDDRQEAGIRDARKPRGRVVWQQKGKKAERYKAQGKRREKESGDS